MLTLQERLVLKLEVAADLYRDGKISRAECFKHEVAISVQKDPGPIVLLPKPRKPDPFLKVVDKFA